MKISLNKSIFQPLKLFTSIENDLKIFSENEDNEELSLTDIVFDGPRDKLIRNIIKPNISDKTANIDHDVHSQMIQMWFSKERVSSMDESSREKIEDGLIILRQADNDRFISQTMRKLLIKA